MSTANGNNFYRSVSKIIDRPVNALSLEVSGGDFYDIDPSSVAPGANFHLKKWKP